MNDEKKSFFTRFSPIHSIYILYMQMFNGAYMQFFYKSTRRKILTRSLYINVIMYYNCLKNQHEYTIGYERIVYEYEHNNYIWIPVK